MPLHHMQKCSWGRVTQLTSFWYSLAGDFWAGQGVPQCTGTACAPYPWYGVWVLAAQKRGTGSIAWPELDAEVWNKILPAQWDYTPSYRVRGSDLGFCSAGSSAPQVCHSSKVKAALPWGTVVPKTVASFCHTQGMLALLLPVLKLGMQECNHTDWKAAVNLRFSPGMLNLLALPKELVPKCLPPCLLRSQGMLRVKEADVCLSGLTTLPAFYTQTLARWHERLSGSRLTAQHCSHLAGGRRMVVEPCPSAEYDGGDGFPVPSRWGCGSWFLRVSAATGGRAGQRDTGEGRYLAFLTPCTRIAPSQRDHKIPKKFPNDQNPTLFL